MCGIVALAGNGNPTLLQQMVASLSHRGPDAGGYQWFDRTRVGLGHRRLAILDLSPAGNQPMADPTGRYWIVYNGEIYNFRTLRKQLERKGYHFRSNTDTEVLLYGWIDQGNAFLERCNGMFAFALYDTETNSLFIARDRLGIKPLYYAVYQNTLIIASEIKAILLSGLIPIEADLTALCNPTRFQITPRTGFRYIRKLPAGWWGQWHNHQLQLHSYWEIHPTEQSLEEAEAVDRLDQLLQDAVSLQMIADVPVGVFLSGGLDSSLVAAMMRQQTTEDIHAFTIAFAPEDQRFEQLVEDHRFARSVARHFGFVYHEFTIHPDIVELLPKMIWHLDEPIGDPAAINTYLIAQAARQQNIFVLLNGVGGDEVFGGYRKYLACLKAEVYQSIVPKFLRTLLETAAQWMPVASHSRGFRLLRWLKRFLSFASLPPFERYLSSDLSFTPQQFTYLFSCSAYTHTHFYQAQRERFTTPGLSYLTRMCWNDTKVFLTEHNLTYTDKATMAASVEARPPLIDHRIVEFAFTFPPAFRIRGNTQKYLLKKVAQRYLPRDIVYRPKAPFASPLRSWIRGALAPMIDDVLSPDSLKRRGIFRPEAVRQLILEDRSGKADHALAIWTLLTVELWFRTFIDQAATLQQTHKGEVSSNATSYPISKNR